MSKLYYVKREQRVIKKITYKGYNAYIVSYGMHPCCYIEIPKENTLYELDYCEEQVENIGVHGGITFSDFTDFGEGVKWYIGWDYAHYGDYTEMGNLSKELSHLCGNKDSKKWTIKELTEEIKDVIKQIKSL